MNFSNVIFLIVLGISICLLVAGFVLPPLGIIDNSVLIAVSELGFLYLLSQIPNFIKSAKSTKITKGSTTIEIEGRGANDKSETSKN